MPLSNCKFKLLLKKANLYIFLKLVNGWRNICSLQNITHKRFTKLCKRLKRTTNNFSISIWKQIKFEFDQPWKKLFFRYIPVFAKEFVISEPGLIVLFSITLLSVMYSAFSDIVQSNGYNFWEVMYYSGKHYSNSKPEIIVDRLKSESKSIERHFIFVLDHSGSTSDKNIKAAIHKTNSPTKDFSEFKKFKQVLDELILAIYNDNSKNINDTNNISINKWVSKTYDIRSEIFWKTIASIRGVPNAKCKILILGKKGKKIALYDITSDSDSSYWINAADTSIYLERIRYAMSTYIHHNYKNANETPFDIILNKVNNYIKDTTDIDFSLCFISDFIDSPAQRHQKSETRRRSIEKQISKIASRNFAHFRYFFYQLPAKANTGSIDGSFEYYIPFENFRRKTWLNDIYFQTLDDKKVLSYELSVIPDQIYKTSLHQFEEKALVVPYHHKQVEKEILAFDLQKLPLFSSLKQKEIYIALKCENRDYRGLFLKIRSQKSTTDSTFLLQIGQAKRISGELELQFEFVNRFSNPPEKIWVEIIPQNAHERYFLPIVFQRIIPLKFVLFYYFLLSITAIYLWRLVYYKIYNNLLNKKNEGKVYNFNRNGIKIVIILVVILYFSLIVIYPSFEQKLFNIISIKNIKALLLISFFLLFLFIIDRVFRIFLQIAISEKSKNESLTKVLFGLFPSYISILLFTCIFDINLFDLFKYENVDSIILWIKVVHWHSAFIITSVFATVSCFYHLAIQEIIKA